MVTHWLFFILGRLTVLCAGLLDLRGERKGKAKRKKGKIAGSIINVIRNNSIRAKQPDRIAFFTLFPTICIIICLTPEGLWCLVMPVYPRNYSGLYYTKILPQLLAGINNLYYPPATL
jgi:hypothetical protein